MPSLNYRVELRKLKKQVRRVQKKENQAKNKLKNAFRKIRKLTRSYKSKLSTKVRALQVKAADKQSVAYTKIAEDIANHILHNIEKKNRALAKAMSKIEKKHVAIFTRAVAKKAKKLGKVKMKSSPAEKKMSKKSKRRRKN